MARVRAALTRGEAIEVELLNYRRDGAPFWNALFISPVRDTAGNLVFFYGTHVDLTASKNLERELNEANRGLEVALERQKLLLREVDHRVKNNLQLVASLLHLQSRSFEDAGLRTLVDNMIERVAAIGTLHTKLYQATDVGQLDVGAYLAQIARETLATSGRQGSIELDVEIHADAAVRIQAHDAASFGLMVNELVTNAVKHAFPQGRPGRLLVRLASGTSDDTLFQIEDDGIGRALAEGPGGFGTTLLTTLAKQLGAAITWEDAEPGTRATVARRAKRHLPTG